MNMNIQLVTFEQAKSLQELGFSSEDRNWNYSYYDIRKGYVVSDCQIVNYDPINQFLIVAPTLEHVAKWLREERNIHICPRYYKWLNGNSWYQCELNSCWIGNGSVITKFNSYEEALSSGIDKAIEMLKCN